MIALEYIKKYYTDATRNNTQHSELFLDAQIDKAEKKLRNLVDLFTEGQISKEEFAEVKAAYTADLQKFKDEKARCGEQQELFENCMCDMTAVSQALAGKTEFIPDEDFIRNAVHTIAVEDNRFVWKFHYTPTALNDDNATDRAVIYLDSKENSAETVDLPDDITKNPLFAKNLSLILHLDTRAEITQSHFITYPQV